VLEVLVRPRSDDLSLRYPIVSLIMLALSSWLLMSDVSIALKVT